MGIGGCVLLFALGAVFAFGVDWHLSGVNLHAVGWIMMFAALLGLVTYVSVFRRRRFLGRPGGEEIVEERRYYDAP
ncbi:hypothetical protein CFP65_5701 [Kitasatospora sp. MMS16-BH015]|uniref:DUF6458 family protein n=1 Tax=Kitasatospora sp. MMS16-BH015 TaxID=2018025 RepID=UPI000CA2FC0C|nr:DUF6458 family protein [Kitasatospora sp. MMS16-BH015]AUG80395.1 hypothetical protein CFP65_5701 [Kitasatospora sp. MMS16-BH015]